MSTYQPPYHFQAVYRAYPEVMYIDDEKGAFDKDNNEIVLEQSKIDTALAEIAELEKQRQGQPMPVTLLNESKSKEKMESHNGESSDKADFIPYIFPDITTIVK